MNTVPPSHPKPAVAPSGTDHDALPPGTRFGEFEILRVLGVGGFGIVYLAHDHSLEREVALKEYMPASLAARGQGPQITVRSSSFAETYAIGLRSFVNEARLLARFDHPSLVKVYRFWEDNATAYMVMPFLQGVTLRDTRRAMPHPPDEAWIRSVVTPILSALELLHKEGVYHRDIAPDNILLPPDGPPVLLDFGAARRVISDRTQSLTAILKPSYAPIEQYAEMVQMRQGPWTDLYALGAVIHYLLFGVPPAPATARAVQDDADTIESRIVPGVSPLFLEAVSWMLSIRPNQRPQNGEELRAVLDGRAAIPVRGRPGITLPGALAPAAAAGAPTAAPPFEPTRHVDHAVDPSRHQTAHMPTYLPTAQMPPPGTPRPSTFSPTSQMPTARGPSSQFDPAPPPPAARAAPSPVTAAPAPPTHAMPAAARTAPPRTQPAPPAAQASRPAPLSAAAASRPVAPARTLKAPVGKATPSSKTGLVVGAGALFVAIAAVAGWQILSRRDAAGPDAAIAAASAASATGAPNVAAAPIVVPAPTTVPAVAPAVVPAGVPVAPPAAPAGVAVPGATQAAVVVPPPGASTTAVAASASSRTIAANAPAVPAVAADLPRAASTAAARPMPPPGVDGKLPTDRAVADRSSIVSPATAASAASGPRPRVVAGRPVPANDGTGPSGTPPYGTPSYGNPTAAVPSYGSGANATPGLNAGDRSRPSAVPSVRDAVAMQRPAPVVQADAGAPASAREACGKRVFISLAICMDEKCEEPRFRNTQECVGILSRKTARENR